MELQTPVVITFPGRFALRGNLRNNKDLTESEIVTLAKTISDGVTAVTGTYMRLCDCVRESDIDEGRLRQLLEPHFSQPRISELLRVARAPDEIYHRYQAGFFGFKAALRATRGYTVTPRDGLRKARLRRVASRLISLLGGAGELRVHGSVVSVRAA